MLSTVMTSAVVGIEAFPVEVEVDIANGLPAFNMVGLPDASCRESADRVRAAVKNSGFPFPSKKITVNLAPADIKKEGSAYDLAIAVGILVAHDLIPETSVSDKVFCGELSLDGSLRSVHGVLPRAASLLQGATKRALVLPQANASEAVCVEGITAYAAKTLWEVIQFLKGEKEIPPFRRAAAPVRESVQAKGFDLDFSDIRGQSQAKRGLEIAAAGGHNVLMIGPPGAGKTMLAKRVPTILTELTFEEAMETTKIHSVAGLLPKKAMLLSRRPFRDPHHTISDAAMVGGGTYPKPGEISLAHHGVLFLDELAEFRRHVLEVMRQPLEEGSVTISRAASSLTWPARFMLVAAMNPCPCGYYTDPKRECNCTSVQIKQYMSKISGPLLDRIDIQLEIPRPQCQEITAKSKGESSAPIRERVKRARNIQRERYAKTPIVCNTQLEAQLVEAYCEASAEAESLLKMAVQELGFSARAYHKALKVARTIADLEGSKTIEAAHVSEAIHYRALDGKLWFR